MAEPIVELGRSASTGRRARRAPRGGSAAARRGDEPPGWRAARQPALPRRARQARADPPRRGPGRLSRRATRRSASPPSRPPPAVSNQTFYDHFPGKREAFVAAFDALAAKTLSVVGGGRGGAGRARLGGRRRSGSACGRCSTTSPPTGCSPGWPSSSCPWRARRRSTTPTTSSAASSPTSRPSAARPDGTAGPESDPRRDRGGIWAVIQHEIAQRQAARAAAARAPRSPSSRSSPFGSDWRGRHGRSRPAGGRDAGSRAGCGRWPGARGRARTRAADSPARTASIVIPISIP